MKQSVGALKRALQKRVRQEVRKSPELWREYRRVRQNSLVEYLRWCVYTGAILVFAIGSAGLLTGDYGENAEPPTDKAKEWSLTLQTMFASGFALLYMNIFWSFLWQSPHVTALAYLPVTDHEHFQQLLKRIRLFGLVGGLLFLSSYAFFAWFEQYPWHIWVILVCLASLQGGVSAGFVFLLLGRIGQMLALALAALLLGASIFGRPPSWNIRQFADGTAQIVMAFLPNNWINTAVYHGIVRGNIFGWLWLLPVFQLLVLAHRRATNCFRIWTFVINPGMDVEGVPDAESLKWKGNWVSELSESSAITLACDSFVAEHIAAPAVQLPALRPEELGWIERLFFHWLSARERVVTELHFVDPTRWSRWFLRGYIAIFGSSVFLVIPVDAQNLPCVMFPAALALLWTYLTSPGWSYLSWLPGVPSLVNACAWWPIGHSEMSRLLEKSNLAGCLCVAPLAVLYGVAAALKLGIAPEEGIIAALKTIYLLLASYPCVIVAELIGNCGDTTDSFRGLSLVLVGSALFVALLSAAVMTFATELFIVLAGLVIAPLVSGAALRGCLWVLTRTGIDVVRK